MITVIIVLTALVALYIYGTRTFNYWTDRGIKHDKPVPLLGNNTANFFLRRSIAEIATDLYTKYPNEKVVGFFRATRPELVIRDPELIKRVLSTDFWYFHRRGLISDTTVMEPMTRNLFFADGDLWRLLRKRTTSAFSSGKLKAMFPLVCSRAKRLQETLSSIVNGEAKTMDARDLMARYTTDFTGSVAFGIDANSLEDENSAFRILAKSIFEPDLKVFFFAVLKELFPRQFRGVKLMEKIEKQITSIVGQILKQRNYEPSDRHDFLDLLLECKKKGTIVTESIERTKPDGSPEITSVEFDDELIMSQVFVFFIAGVETSSSANSYTLHQLAFHPEVQRKKQDEIDRVLSKYENKLCYDAINEMTYLEWTFQEGMRLMSPVGFLMRRCARKYKIPGLDVTIDPGVGMMIPVQALHKDPQIFDNPEEFRPERFHPDEFNQTRKSVYLPFGEGPRACIRARLGQMQSLAGLAAVLSKFSVEPAPETLRHPVVDPKGGVVQTFKGGIPLKFRPRESKI